MITDECADCGKRIPSDYPKSCQPCISRRKDKALDKQLTWILEGKHEDFGIDEFFPKGDIARGGALMIVARANMTLANQREELQKKVLEVFHEFVHSKLLAGTEAYNAGKKLEAIFDE